MHSTRPRRHAGRATYSQDKLLEVMIQITN
jgi:hypothetical protein